MQDETQSRTFGEALWDWLENRNYWRLFLAGPAFLACVGLAAFAVYHFGWRPARAEAQCQKAGGEALAAGQYQRASLAYQSLIRLRGQPEPDSLFRIARCFGELDRRPEAAAMISALAPTNRPGYAPAHLFLARVLLESIGADPRALSVAEAHLRNVLQQESQNTDAHEALGRIYLQVGRWDDARRHLMEVVAVRPETAMLLAVTQRELGDEPGSKAWAGRAVKFFSARTEEALQDDPRARLGWANALAMLKEYEPAAAVLETGREKAGNAVYGPALAQVCGQWALHLGQEQPADRAARLRILERGLEVSSSDPVLLRELARLVRARGAEAEPTRRALVPMLAAGTHAPWLHLCLAALAHQRGDAAEAGIHFKAAYTAAPGIRDLANNLASTLIEEGERDPGLASALMQPLLERYPEHPFYRDTRGQILLRQGQPKAALADLEFALSKLPDKTGTHRALADAYGRLGMTELAAEHARQAEAGGADGSRGRPPRTPKR